MSDWRWVRHERVRFGDCDPMVVPAALPPDVAERVRDLSVRAFESIGGWGLARVDFLYDQHLDRLVVNELNTMPGFTAHSMYPKVWAASGLGYSQLLDRLVELALDRDRRRRRRRAIVRDSQSPVVNALVGTAERSSL